MPTLAFLQLNDQGQNRPPVRNHGYDSEFFQEVDQLFDHVARDDPEIDVRDTDRIQANLLQTGPCPGDARVYHTFVSSPEIPGGDERIGEILGHSVDVTRREAGRLFEQWVDEANRALNRWIDSDDLSEFDDLDMPDYLIEYYKEQAKNIGDRIDVVGVDREELKMDVQYEVDTEIFHSSEPDGVWLPDDMSGGVFESKLSLPPDPVDRHLLAGYAVQLERASGVPVHSGVYLSLDDGLSEPEVEAFQIDDVLRSRIRENIQKFTKLVSRSKINGTWDESDPLSHRLAEPHEPKYANACRSCPYLHQCHGNGQYFNLRDDIYPTIANLKLSGSRVLDVLESISVASPRRDNVKTSVMELFPEKDPKSVFRGMVVPSLTRLHLIRSENEGQIIKLSPNGKYIVRGNMGSHRERLSTCIEDLIVSHLKITQDAIRFFRDHMDDISVGTYDNFTENINRLQRQYIEEFDIRLPEQDDGSPELIDVLYRGSQREFLINDQLRRDILQQALLQDRRDQFEDARWRVLKEIDDRDVIASSWFVDELIWREWKSANRVIDLREGSTYEDIRLTREGRSYDAVKLTDANRGT